MHTDDMCVLFHAKSLLIVIVAIPASPALVSSSGFLVAVLVELQLIKIIGDRLSLSQRARH